MKFTKTKIIYRTLSIIQSILFFVFRLAYLAVALFALYHYAENPVLTIIVAIVCGIFFIVTVPDEIIVYADSLQFSDGLLPGISKRNKHYKIADIESILVNGDYSTGDELISRQLSWNEKPLNQIEIKLKDGTSQIFKTSIYIDKLKMVTEEINNLKKQ